jgi:hypothetical protein
MSFNKKFFTTGGIVASSPSGTTGTDNFDIVTYTGNGGTQSISSLDFQPDLVWIKHRGVTGTYHQIYDSVRGATKVIFSNDTLQEFDRTNGLTSFDSNGFSLGNHTHSNDGTAPNDLVAWCWKAGGAAVSNTEGTITSQVSANQDAGFSIVKYTGTLNSAGNVSVGHGLSQAPELIISKRIDSTGSWRIRPFSLNNNPYDYLEFDTGALAQFSASDGVMALPTSTTFDNNWNSALGGAGDVIAYCFHSVDGYQKIGSYTGNTSTLPSVNLGFSPRFVMIKETTDTGSWLMYDNVRPSDPVTQNDKILFANDSSAESTSAGNVLNFTSTGFDIEAGSSELNTNGNTYIYLAIA